MSWIAILAATYNFFRKDLFIDVVLQVIFKDIMFKTREVLFKTRVSLGLY